MLKIIGIWKLGSFDEVGIFMVEVNQNRIVWMEEQFSIDGSWCGFRKLFLGGGCLNIIIFRGVVVWNFFFDFLELCRKFLLMGEK